MRVYMIGIGGIGMSALAQLYAHGGATVFGSDREVSPVTELLEKKGIRVLIGQKTENVPSDADFIIYSDAVWPDNLERVRAKELGIREMSYFQALGEVSKGKKTIAISGTHGKTTTTGMLAKILVDAGKQPTAVVGSIMKDFDSNFVPGLRHAEAGSSLAKAGDPDLFVVEACEYKDHILELHPKILVITNLEWDHTDFFTSFESLQETFRKAVANVPQDGVIIANPRDANVAPVLEAAKCQVIDYTKETVPELALVGEFNTLNAQAAKAAARAVFADLPEATIDVSIAGFKGTWRRFEVKGTTKEGALVVDDYAHHPTAIRATLKAARGKFPDKKIIVAFHPHLYSRTRDLMEEFAAAFEDADEVVFAPIYAARENPVEGITSEALSEKVVTHGKHATAFPSLHEVENYLRSVSSSDVVFITMGAGDIYTVADRMVS